MADGFALNLSELDAMANDFAASSKELVVKTERVMKAAATQGKAAVQVAFELSPYFRRAARTVTYDRLGFAGRIGYEIGPEVRDAGALAGIAIDGGANGGGGTVSLKLAEGQVQRALERDMAKVIEEIL